MIFFQFNSTVQTLSKSTVRQFLPTLTSFLQGMVEPGEQISTTLKKEFMEEALAGLDMKDEEREELKRKVMVYSRKE